ncbi:hypothetical protein ACA910_008924 [Epithemia clementina (nom. ined.)]
MQSLQSSIQSAIKDIQSMTNTEDKNLHVKHEALDFEIICCRVKDLYRNLIDNGRWSPVKNYKDTRGALRNFGAHHASAEAFVLEQRHVPRSTAGRQGGCHLCRSLSHWRNNCPLTITANNASRTISNASSPSGRGGRSFGNRSGPHHSGRIGRSGHTSPQNRSRNSWRLLPHTDNTTIKFVNGIRFYWYQTCRNWTTTHNNSGHTGAPPSNRPQHTSGRSSDRSSHSPPSRGRFPSRFTPVSPGNLLRPAGLQAAHNDSDFPDDPMTLNPSAWLCAPLGDFEPTHDMIMDDLPTMPNTGSDMVPHAFPASVSFSAAHFNFDDASISDEDCDIAMPGIPPGTPLAVPAPD